MAKVDRVLSQIIWEHRHIDDLNKALLVVLVRNKEEYVAKLETKLENLQEVLDAELSLRPR